MAVIAVLHRWGGGLLGLILGILGLSGAILLHKEEWIRLPHSSDAPLTNPAQLGQLAERLLAKAKGGDALVFANDRFGLAQLRSGNGGLYASQDGDIVARWSHPWDRPELWLFDLHHHLLTGEAGKVLVGLSGIAAMIFVVTGTILWWRTRRFFRPGLWPARMTGPAIRAHHRDIGIIVAPLLFPIALTGAMMAFPRVAQAVLAPLSSPALIEADLRAPRFHAAPLSSNLDWKALVGAACRAFPGARIRSIALPRKASEPVTVRMKQADEWLPNGRTMLWFDPATGILLAKRDALKMQPGTRAFNMAYPIHAGKVGGLAYRLVLTALGLALALLGSLSVWSFWSSHRKPISG